MHEGLWYYGDEQRLVATRKYGKQKGIILGIFPKMVEIIVIVNKIRNKDILTLVHHLRKEKWILFVVRQKKLVKIVHIISITKDTILTNLILHAFNETCETRFVLKRKIKLGGFLCSPLSRSKIYNKHFIPR